MSEPAQVVSLAERLKRRRQELGMSQAQAARELDVARTAYRLWEMEAAKPHPDRWRLISRWLGVSVTTMLLANELDEATGADNVTAAFERVGRDWDTDVTDPRAFFAEAHRLIQDGTQRGFVSTGHAEELLALFRRIEEERIGDATAVCEPVKLHKQLRADERAPKTARDAVVFAAADLPGEIVQTAQLLTTELVTNSVRHGPKGARVTIYLDVDIGRERLRVEVSDRADSAPQLTEPSENGGYGLTLLQNLASHWATERTRTGNRTWFELDLTHPGASPNARKRTLSAA